VPIHEFEVHWTTTGFARIRVTEEEAERIQGEQANSGFLAFVELVREDGRVVAVELDDQRHETVETSEHTEVTQVSYEPRSEEQI
jgi:hypothetical protein